MNKEPIEKYLDRLFARFPNTDAPEHAMRSFRRRYRRKNFVPTLYRAAAILILPLATLSIYLYLNHLRAQRPQTPTIAMVTDNPDLIIEYTVNPGVKGRIQLPDGSEVWLNSHSSLISPARYRDDFRIVELSGEALFDVINDPQRPMYIRTSKNITVQVTGTKFNVSTYANDDFFNLHLISGSVRLINENSREEFDVLPTQEIYVKDTDQKFKLKKDADERLNTAWKDGYLVFDATLISEVVRKMERWYGVTIEVTAPAILKEKFTADFKSESLTQVLDFLKISSNINYLITDEKVVLSY